MTRCVQGYGHRFTDGDAYIDVITWLYDRRDISSFRRKEMQRYAVALDIAIDCLLVHDLRSRLPCSAFVVSYNAMIVRISAPFTALKLTVWRDCSATVQCLKDFKSIFARPGKIIIVQWTLELNDCILA